MSNFLKVFFFLVIIFLANFFFVTEVEAQSYYLQSTLASENLLQGESDVELITAFDATTSIPTGAAIEVQFSRNGHIWHDSNGTRWGSDDLSDGSNSFDLSGLDWDQAYFYYKVKLSTDNASTTPELLAVDVSYSSDPQDAPDSEYHETGTMISENLLEGETDVELITNFQADLDIPDNTEVSVQFSRNSISWFDSAGVEWASENLSDGLNEIDLSSLEWSGSDFYYKLTYQTASSTQTASVNEVEVNYSDDPEEAPDVGHYGYGTFTSDNLVARQMPGAGLESFSYKMDLNSATATSAWIQFSNDGETFYSATGTEWGWTELPESGRSSRDNAIDLSDLDWTATAFYYKIRFQTDDPSVAPELSGVKPNYEGAIRVNAPSDDILPEGLVGHWSFGGRDMKWHETGAEVRDSSGYGNHGSLEGGMNTRSVTSGVWEQAFSFDESQNDHIEATVPATTTISLWYNTGDDWQHLVKNDGSYYVNAVSDTPDTFPVYTDGGTVHIGKDEAGSFVSGKIDDVRIYNRALSEEEIQKLYEKAGQRFVITPREEEADCDDDVWICEQNDVCPSYLGDGDYIVVANEDLGSTYEWGPVEDCVGPQCEEIEGDMTLVVDNSVDFSDYPARDACKAIGGRLPNIDELQCIYNNKTTFGDNFEDANYWSATEFHTYFARRVWLSGGDTYNYYKDYSNYVRCVRGW